MQVLANALLFTLADFQDLPLALAAVGDIAGKAPGMNETTFLPEHVNVGQYVFGSSILATESRLVVVDLIGGEFGQHVVDHVVIDMEFGNMLSDEFLRLV